MWAEKRANGKVRFRERYEHPFTGEELKVSITMDKDTVRNRKAAHAALNDQIMKNLKELCAPIEKTDLKLCELVELYRKDQEHSVKGRTYTRNYYACESLMSILGEKTLVSRITAGYVRSKLLETGESNGTMNERITRFKALIRWGYKNDHVEDAAYLDKIEKFPDETKVIKLEEKFLESDELKTLLNYMQVDIWKLLTLFLALSGLRIGEAIALLDKEDVQLDSSIIIVNKTYDYNDNLIHDIIDEDTENDGPKTISSNREVYIQPELITVCKKIRTYMKREKLKYGFTTDLFMSDINGEHIDYYSYNKYLKENAEKCLDKKNPITPHVLRHTHVALMAENDIPLDIISRRLGHKNSKITKDIYFHVTKKLQNKDNERISKVQIL